MSELAELAGSVFLDVVRSHRDPLAALIVSPPIASRTGIDLDPVDVTDPDQRRWLRALVWPENRADADLLDRPLAATATDPPAGPVDLERHVRTR